MLEGNVEGGMPFLYCEELGWFYIYPHKKRFFHLELTNIWELSKLARGLKVPFRYELLNILLAMELAYDVEGDLETRRWEYCADDSAAHCDEQFILQMAALMREHWDQ